MLFEVSLMNFILWVSKVIKWKAKVVLLEVSLMNLHSSDIQRNQMEGEGCVTQSIIDELHSADLVK